MVTYIVVVLASLVSCEGVAVVSRSGNWPPFATTLAGWWIGLATAVALGYLAASRARANRG